MDFSPFFFQFPYGKHFLLVLFSVLLGFDLSSIYCGNLLEVVNVSNYFARILLHLSKLKLNLKKQAVQLVHFNLKY